MRTVLVTGVSGNIGSYLVPKLMEEYNVIGFDLETKKNHKMLRYFNNTAKQVNGSYTHYFGDLRLYHTIEPLLSHHIDYVIHLAFIIPPQSEVNPELSHTVNVQGSKNLIQLLLEMMNEEIKFVFCSSVATYGHVPPESPPRKANDPLSAISKYAEHKILLEEYLRSKDIQSQLNWTIVKFPAVLSPKQYTTVSRESIQYAKTIDPSTKLQPCHVLNIVEALFNITKFDFEKIQYSTFILGGHEKDRLNYQEYLTRILSCFFPVEEDDIPWDEFEAKPYYLHWYDITNEREIFDYLHLTFDDFLSNVKKSMPLHLKLARLTLKLGFMKIPFVKRHVIKIALGM